jgi:hypothetical protein
LGRRQVVRPGVLIPVFAGSNPAVPAMLKHREAMTLLHDTAG